MKMTEKIEQSRQAAQTALDAYSATGAGDPDDVVATIGDLLADLLHLADQKMAEANAEQPGTETAWNGAVSVHGLARVACDHYEYESDSDHADEEV